MNTYLGQNFLSDKKYIDWVVKKLFELSDKYKLNSIVEIGPGKGAITRYLVNKIDLLLFEKDRKFLDIYKKWWDLNFVGKVDNFEIRQNIGLSSYTQVLAGDVQTINLKSIEQFNFLIKLYLGDFLKATLDLDNFGESLFFGNLPYYITSPILTKVATEFKPQVALFMVQKEVGEKIDLNTNKKSYLRWILNYFYNVRCVKKVPAKAFSPPPKVDSCWVELVKKSSLPNLPLSWLQKFLNLIISKRQTLKKNLARQGIKIDLEVGNRRTEELDWEDMENLYDYLKNEI